LPYNITKHSIRKVITSCTGSGGSVVAAVSDAVELAKQRRKLIDHLQRMTI